MIELIVVIGVIGVLAGGLLIVINPIGQIKKAHDAQRKSDLHQIKLLLEQYYNDHGKYPQAQNSVHNCAYGSNCYVYSRNANIITPGTLWITPLDSYTSSLPKDPVNNGEGPWATGIYTYAYGNVDGQHYDLFTQVENTSDPQRCGLLDYRWYYQLYTSGQHHWCPGDGFAPDLGWGGHYSNYIYAVDQ